MDINALVCSFGRSLLRFPVPFHLCSLSFWCHQYHNYLYSLHQNLRPSRRNLIRVGFYPKVLSFIPNLLFHFPFIFYYLFSLSPFLVSFCVPFVSVASPSFWPFCALPPLCVLSFSAHIPGLVRPSVLSSQCIPIVPILVVYCYEL